jgi:hypothetical protein
MYNTGDLSLDEEEYLGAIIRQTVCSRPKQKDPQGCWLGHGRDARKLRCASVHDPRPPGEVIISDADVHSVFPYSYCPWHPSILQSCHCMIENLSEVK